MNRLKQYLEGNGISVYQLSKRSGIAYSTVNYIVNNRTPIEKCEIGTFMRLASALGLSITDAFKKLVIDTGSPIPIHSDAYDIDGILYTENDHYVIESYFDDSLHSRRLLERCFIYNGFEEDYGLFSLEDMYVDHIIGGL